MADLRPAGSFTTPATPATIASTTAPAAPVAAVSNLPVTSKKGGRRPDDWDKLAKEVEKEESEEKVEGDAALNKLFKQIYRDGGSGLDDGTLGAQIANFPLQPTRTLAAP